MKPDSETPETNVRWFWTTLAVCFIFALAVAALFNIPIRPRRPAIPPSGPVYIRILPGDYLSLVNHEVVVTNLAIITDIVAAVAAAKKYFPNHPHVRWRCYMVISDASGDTYYRLYDTTGQGTVLQEETSLTGVIFSTRRNDSLGADLERATASAP